MVSKINHSESIKKLKQFTFSQNLKNRHLQIWITKIISQKYEIKFLILTLKNDGSALKLIQQQKRCLLPKRYIFSDQRKKLNKAK